METKNHSAQDVKKTTYKCPMQCEGDKVYDHPGNCPVCNMKLAPAEAGAPHGHHHCC